MDPNPRVTLDDVALARRVLRTEAQAILSLADQLDGAFERAVQLLVECRGRVILTGMGKSGIIARKIAATFSSTGTASYFMHPAEAIHGDLGMIQGDDAVVALSYSGETPELLRLLETIRRLGARLVAVTGSRASTLGQAADVTIGCHVPEEACPWNVVPTASTTATLAVGDALAIALLVRKGIALEAFASLHPGGGLGKRLMRVEHLMTAGDRLPSVGLATPMRDVIYVMSSKGLGMTCVVDAGGRLAGIITDGDLRRHMTSMPDVLDRLAADVMTRDPITIEPGLLAVQALNLMEQRKITSLPVVDSGRAVLGVVHLHDLWRTEMF